MPYLDTYNTPLTAITAAHLLRRATFGPTKGEISEFTGLTANQAVEKLIANSKSKTTTFAPLDLDKNNNPNYGKPFLELGLSKSRSTQHLNNIVHWWVGQMLEPSGAVSLLEKLAAFWQNHFVVSHTTVLDYRLLFQYLEFLRGNCLGSFRTLAIEMSKNAGMLIYQNGNENQKISPNENYARELQELFVVGEKDFNGNPNYTENDVKAASKILTGWQVKGNYVADSTSFSVTYTPERHDETNKTFSSHYNNTIVPGNSGSTGGDVELSALIDMLLAHPHTPKFICRKLYRWYVNPYVTQEIEDNVIAPLASFLVSPANNYNIEGALKKLLTSQEFFDAKNYGSMIKSPLEWVIGTIRFFDKPLPSALTELEAYRIMVVFASTKITLLQVNLLNQPLVKGSTPYYQFGLTKNWLNVTTIGQRNTITNYLVFPTLEIKPGYNLAIDFLTWIKQLQPNFADRAGTPAIPCEVVLESFLQNLLVLNLTQAQKDLLIDKYMMSNLSRSTWINDMNRYRTDPNSLNNQSYILSRCRSLMSQILSLAEYHLF
jgi:uncharacterized protein (DUF1800 family)